jgi:hypothetical protein
MILSFFKKLFATRETKSPSYIIARLNDRIMPIDRGDVYEDPIDEFLKVKYYGKVTGGGTQLTEGNDIEYCEIEIETIAERINEQAIAEIIAKLEEFGAPKGSELIIEKTGEKIAFGKLEGLGLFLDGVNLSAEVYENLDATVLAAEIRRLADIKSDVVRYWNGNTETGLYFYGSSFDYIKNAIANFVNTHPACENARIERVA